VYLRDGIYGESTLHYRAGKWTAWPHTYADYADGRYDAFFERVRDLYRSKLDASGQIKRSEGGRL
jgi:hypothetical protein